VKFVVMFFCAVAVSLESDFLTALKESPARYPFVTFRLFFADYEVVAK